MRVCVAPCPIRPPALSLLASPINAAVLQAAHERSLGRELSADGVAPSPPPGRPRQPVFSDPAAAVVARSRAPAAACGQSGRAVRLRDDCSTAAASQATCSRFPIPVALSQPRNRLDEQGGPFFCAPRRPLVPTRPAISISPFGSAPQSPQRRTICRPGSPCLGRPESAP